MAVPVMQVRVVRMPVHEPLVRVLVRVRLDAVPIGLMRVLMMLVMDVPVRVGQRLVLVKMHVTLGKVQPHAGSHQHGGDPESGSGRFAEQP